MVNRCSWMIVVTLLHLIFGVNQYQASDLAETKQNFEKKQHNTRTSSKAGQAPSIFKINTDSVPDGRQNFNPWGGKKRSEVDRNSTPGNYSVNQDPQNQRQKRRLISPYGVRREDFGCELGDFTVCGLRLYQADPKMDSNVNSASEETAPKLFYNGIKGSVLYGIKKNFNSWGGKRSLDFGYPKDGKVNWDNPKYKEGKISTEFINQIRNSILFTSRGSYKPHASDDVKTVLPENNDSNDKYKEENSVLNNNLDGSPLNYHEPGIDNLKYVITKRKTDGKATGNETRGKALNDLIGGIYGSVDESDFQPKKRGGQVSAETWESDRSQNNVRNQAAWKDKNFSELLHTMRLLNPWKGEKESEETKNYVSGSPNRNLRNFEPWAGKRSGFIKYPIYATFDSSNSMTPKEEFSRNLRNFEAWGGKRNYYSWGGKRSGNYLNSIPKFGSKSSNIVKRNVRSNPDTKLIFFKGNINTWVNKTRKLNSWGGKRKLSENLKN